MRGCRELLALHSVKFLDLYLSNFLRNLIFKKNRFSKSSDNSSKNQTIDLKFLPDIGFFISMNYIKFQSNRLCQFRDINKKL